MGSQGTERSVSVRQARQRPERCGSERLGQPWQAWIGGAWPGGSTHGASRQAGTVWRVSGLGRPGPDRRGLVGKVRRGMAGLAWCAPASQGSARQAWSGTDGLGATGQRTERQVRCGGEWPGTASYGRAGQAWNGFDVMTVARLIHTRHNAKRPNRWKRLGR